LTTALRRRAGAGFALALVLGVAAAPGIPGSSSAAANVKPKPTLTPAGRRVEVLPAGGLGPEHAAALLRKLYPKDSIEADRPSNSVIVSGPASDVAEMKRVMRALVAGAPAAPAPPKTVVVTLSKASAPEVAQTLQRQFPGVRINVLGRQIALTGSPDEVDRAAVLVTGLDAPPANVAFSRVYRVHAFDADSVAAFLTHTFPGSTVSGDATLGTVTVVAPPELQDRVADAIEQIDTGRVAGSAHGLAVAQPGGASLPVAAPDGTTIQVVTLRAAVPAANGGASTNASDIATVLGQTLQRAAPSLHVTVTPNSPQIVLNGTPADVQLARDLIEQLDVGQKLIVLDTEIYEVDETDAKNLGLQLTPPAGSTGTQPYIGTTYSETVPAAPPGSLATAPPLLGLQALTRTPLSLGVQLNLAVQKGVAKVLANPRITTISGRTATIRAGENITVLTTAGGSAGTVATTQLQTFQTGVSLDITPIVNAGNFISVTLHPTVNSLSGTNNGLPQISTRDTQTTVVMQAEQTLVIGGLIQDTYQLTETKIPLLGDLPLVGKIFRNQNKSSERDELIIVVTPHIVTPGDDTGKAGAPLPTPPPGGDLPTLPPETHVITRPIGRRPLTVSSTTALAPSSPYTPKPSAAPLATPTAFGQANQFTFGKPPQNTSAAPGDAAQIFFASLSPTVLQTGSIMKIAAITTSNVTKVTIGLNGYTKDLFAQGQGFWQGNFSFTPPGLFPGQNNVTLILTATKQDGSNTTLQIPVTYSL
jgi:type II secretory pathway component GspD/PulD (secretin)